MNSSPRRARFSACQSVGPEFSAIAQQRDLRISQQFNFANQAIPTVKLSLPSRIGSIGIFQNSERVSVFERFHRSIQRVRHVGMHAGKAVGIRSRAHATCNSFVVGKRLVGSRINAADGQIAHRARTSGGNALRYCLCQRPQKNVNNALRSFNVACGHSCWCAGIDNTSFRSKHGYRADQSGVCRRVFRKQAAKHVENRRVGDSENCVHAAGDLRIRSCEIHQRRRRCRIELDRNADPNRCITKAVAVEEIFRRKFSCWHVR